MKSEKREFIDILDEVLVDYGFTPIIAIAISNILRNPDEYMAIANKDGYYEFMDRGSEELHGLPKGGARGIKAIDLIKESPIAQVLKNEAPIIGKVFDIRGQRRVGSAWPLFRDGELVGAMGRLFFRSLSEFERINVRVNNLKKQVKSLRHREMQQHRALYTFENILGVSDNIRKCIDLAKKASEAGTDVLIVGETGTGKELFAQAIHNFINPDRPFVGINSPAIPFDLAESELFGYTKGAFSGASADGKLGKFELANNGTLFLDEISALPLSIQAKFLRALEEREVQALGDTRTKKVSFRLISATNVDLKKLAYEGKFRMDLYYRLAKISIQIDPVRKRKEDIPILVKHLLKAINRRFKANFKGLSDEVHSCFRNHDWRGNVRELINVLEQACVNKWGGKEITMNCLPPEMIESLSNQKSPRSKRFREMKEEMERESILQALDETNGNKRRAAFLLGMPRPTLYRKIKKYNLET